MGKRLAVFLNSFLLLQSFFWLKMQKSTFFKNKGFESNFFFFKLTFRWLQKGLSDLKNTKQLKLMLVFYTFFLKMSHFKKKLTFLKFTSSSW